mgnify:FL=1|jgi:hypothetical protein
MRTWLKAKEKNPARKGPYCTYHCSSRANVACAPTNRKAAALALTVS